jgi:hypothetical protein
LQLSSARAARLEGKILHRLARLELRVQNGAIGILRPLLARSAGASGRRGKSIAI